MSLAYAALDNPVAQAAWIVERLHNWADLRARPFEAVFPPDHILLDLTTYALIGAFRQRRFVLRRCGRGTDEHQTGRGVKVSASILSHPDPRTPLPPRSWVEKGYRVRRWTALNRGVHFLQVKEHEALAADLSTWGRHP